MAQLHNTRFFTLDPAVWRGRAGPVKVGNNRTLDFEVTPTGAHKLTFRLHNNAVGYLYEGNAQMSVVHVALSDGGWPTRTTARAQEDFLHALGFEARVSYARGGFRLFLHDRTGEHEDFLVELPDQPDMFFFEIRDRYSPRHVA